MKKVERKIFVITVFDYRFAINASSESCGHIYILYCQQIIPLIHNVVFFLEVEFKILSDCVMQG
jgi:hypothetical protein